MSKPTQTNTRFDRIRRIDPDPPSPLKLAQWQNMLRANETIARRLGPLVDEIDNFMHDKLAYLPDEDQAMVLGALSHWYRPSASFKGAKPERAEVLWDDRPKDAKTNPAAFTRALYGEWIAKGMTRKDLKDLDPKLYHALSVWEHRHPEDTITDLLTATDVLNRKIDMLAVEFTEEELRKLGTALQSRHRREKSV